MNNQKISSAVTMSTPKILSSKEQQLLDKTTEERKSAFRDIHNPLFARKDETPLAIAVEYQVQHCEINIPKDKKDSKK